MLFYSTLFWHIRTSIIIDVDNGLKSYYETY
ncbi:Uncharacterised protein [Yersinia enterocolitica]|nr:Uncharacterised protein [Yersinia enterocolitica]CQI01581.1 Uncharacterised protein [Yersinia enterocolitica]